MDTVIKEYTQLASVSGGLAFRSGETQASFRDILEQTLDYSCRQCLHRRLTIHSPQSSYSLDPDQLLQLQTPNNSTQLAPGVYHIRIHTGAFSYWTEHPRFDPEPWIILRLYDGWVVNQQTNVETRATWVTLNGYNDVLKIRVIESINLCAFFMDTYKADNSGQIILSILKADGP